jgi:GrpB-like predicted nucleotidyltransferase (UPF0157 family)
MVRKIEVLPYDPAWENRFHEESARLSKVLGEEILAIHHIGSTAIPGIYAKPIIDILLEVQDIHKLDQFNDAMQAEGYQPEGEFGIPGRRYYFKGTDEQRTCHVHAFQYGDANIERHLVFRDYLQFHSKDAQAYSVLKQYLAQEFSTDIDSYISGKHDLIQEIHQHAYAWWAEQQGPKRG